VVRSPQISRLTHRIRRDGELGQLAVPANRIGHAVYATAQLKTMQEVITLVIFGVFSVLYLKEPFSWNYAIGFFLIAAGAYFVFR
jgi:uncharacterized protein (DUF486 family)